MLHSTTIGDIRLRLRAYPYNTRARRQQFDPRASVDLHLDDDDVARSEPVLADSRALAFELWIPADTSDHDAFQVYLGRDLTSWDDKLSIQLVYRGTQADAGRDWNLWWAEPNDEDVVRIRNEYWCAARAQVTVCIAPRTPLTRPDGTVVRTTVGLGYAGDYEALYKATLDSLAQDSIPGHLAAPFQRYMSFARRDPGDTLAYSLYKRLRSVAEDIERVARSVHARPDAALAPVVTYRDVSLTAAAAYLHQRAGQLTVADVSQAVVHRGRLVPTAFTEVAPAETTDTPANRAAAHALYRVTEAVEMVRAHLQGEEGLSPAAVPAHQTAIRWLDGLARRFRRYRRALPPPLSTATATFDSRYASLQRLADTLDYVLGYVDGDTVPFEVQAFWKLYERWCFIQVIQALQACGFTVVRGTRRASHFYRHPVPDAVNCEMHHPALDGTVLEVWYDKRYPQLWSNADAFDRARPYGLERRHGRSSYRGGKNRPDIILEFHGQRSRAQPDIVILDPTIRAQRPPPQGPMDKAEDKYDYAEAIRSFVETDDRGHSVARVRASWGITPSFRGTAPYALAAAGDFTKGFVHLRPGGLSTNHLESTLRNILEAIKILPINVAAHSTS